MAFALTRFPNFFHNLSVCATSRVTMFTGLTVDHHGVLGNSQAVDWEASGGSLNAIGKWLQTAGYYTGLLGKYLNRVVTDTMVVPGYNDFRALVDDSWRGTAVAVTGNTTNGSAVVTNLSAQVADADIGRVVTGTGIPVSTTIVSHTLTAFTMSNNATATGTAVALNLAGLSGHSGHAMTYTNGYIASNGVLSALTAGDTWTGSTLVGANTTASDNRAAAAASGYQTDWMNRRALSFLDTATEPFYLDLASWAPHGDSANSNKPVPATRHAALTFTADPNPSFNEADISDKPKWVRDTVPSALTGPQQTYAADYDLDAKRCVQAVDELVYDVVRKLTTLGYLDRTVIVIVADNGVVAGEHRLTSQTANSVKNVPYEPSIHNEMFIHWPSSVPSGGRPNFVVVKLDDTAPRYWATMAYLQSAITATNAALVGNIDLAPTFADLGRARMTRRPDGMSLAPLLDGRVAAANFRSQLLIQYSALGDSSVTEMPTWKGVFTSADGYGGYLAGYGYRSKYIRYDALGGDPAEDEFYDLNADADEMTNTVGSLTAAQRAALDARVAALLAG